MTTNRKPLAVAAALLVAAMAFHGYQHIFLVERTSAVFYLLSLMPYALCLIILLFSKNAIPAIAGMCMALLVDAATHYSVFVNEKPPVADWPLAFMPMWSTIFFVPVTAGIARAMVRPGESVPGRFARGAKRTLVILAILIGTFAAYFAYWNYQYQRAQSAANAFCESAAIGSDISAAIARAQAAGIRHSARSNENPAHFFIFQGPIFNAFTCELGVAEGKVTAKGIVALDD